MKLWQEIQMSRQSEWQSGASVSGGCGKHFCTCLGMDVGSGFASRCELSQAPPGFLCSPPLPNVSIRAAVRDRGATATPFFTEKQAFRIPLGNSSCAQEPLGQLPVSPGREPV